MTSLHRNFLGDRIILDGLNKLVLFLFELIFFTLLEYFLQFFLIFLTIFFDAITETLPELDAVFFDFIVFFSSKFVAFAKITLVTTTFLDFTAL
jgi:hypothetical protein